MPITSNRSIGNGGVCSPTRWSRRPFSTACFITVTSSRSAAIAIGCSADRRGSSCSTRIRARARFMASRKTAPTTGISAYYHLLFVFNLLGDVERCVLLPGDVHSADCWRAVLESMVAPLPGHRAASLLPSRRGFRQSRDERVPRNPVHRLRDASLPRGYENIRLSLYTKCLIKRARNVTRPGCKVVRQMELLIDTTDQSGLRHPSRRAISVLAEPNH